MSKILICLLNYARNSTNSNWLLVGLVNGMVLGGVIALLSLAVGGDPNLGFVVLLAMWGNLVVAGFAGSFVPTFLARIGVDPAVASGPLLTTVTDMCGFFLVLSLASLALPLL